MGAGLIAGALDVPAQSAYRMVDLGSLAEYGQSVATAVNATGQVAGWVYDSGYNETRAVLFAGGAIANLGTLPGNRYSVASAISATGAVAGGSAHLNFEGAGFVYRNGSLTDLGTLGGGSYCQAYGVNTAGQVVGESPNARRMMRAFLYENGRMTDLGSLGGDNSSARAINESGQIAGKADTSAANFAKTHAFLHTNGRMTDLGSLGGMASVSWANGLNDSGQVVGGSSVDPFGFGEIGHAFLYSGGRMISLGSLGPYSNSEASGINNAGVIVGSAYDGRLGHNFDNKTGQHAFVYVSGRMLDLNQMVVNAQGWVLLHATAINDSGQIAGYGVTPTGDVHAILLTPTTDGFPPTITRQPASQEVLAGTRATMTVLATHPLGGPLTYQWKKNGVPIAGATGASFVIASALVPDIGFYSVIVSGGGESTESSVAIVTLAPTPGVTARLANLSTRGLVPAGGALTTGFVLRGTGTKQLLVRAIGPSLAAFGLAGALRDPTLELFRAGSPSPLVVNDDWGENAGAGELADVSARAGAFSLSAGSKDAACLASFGTATTGTDYSVRVTAGDGQSSGVVLAEIYDADPGASSVRIGNLSTLATAGAGAEALVVGFVVDGGTGKRVLVRAVGPGLAPFNVAGPLTDPRLQLFAGTLLVAENDDWGGTPLLAGAFTEAGAFALANASRDAALVVTLPPGNYTAHVSGAGSARGNVLVEIYDLP